MFRLCPVLRFRGATSNRYGHVLSVCPAEHKLFPIWKRIPGIKHNLRAIAGSRRQVLSLLVEAHLESVSLGQAVPRPARQYHTLF